VEVTSAGGKKKVYDIDGHGRIDGLPIRDIRNGFTAAYRADEKNVYHMYYALEDYPYFSKHCLKAHLPILVVLLFTVIGIVFCLFLRRWINRKNPEYVIYARGRQKNSLQQKTESKFLLIRWLFLIAGMFLWLYAGKMIGQGQALNEVAIPVFSCPFNLDQVTEVPCYYLSHLPALFTRFGPEFPARNLFYGIVFLTTMLFCFIFLGRILCVFLCPAGFLQDLMDKLRSALHIRPITVTDRMNRILQPIKWIWIVLFLGFAFTGGDFLEIQPVPAEKGLYGMYGMRRLL
jgi:Polyferredoxin